MLRGGLTMAKFDFNGFVRECYLRSNPSVDLDKVTADNPVKCSAHKLSVSEYEKILYEMGVTDASGKATDPDSNVLCACNIWMLQSGPTLFKA